MSGFNLFTGSHLFLTTLVFAFLSGFIPVFNIEAYLLSVVVLGGVVNSAALILASTIGQMTAKCLLYSSGRGIVRLPLKPSPKNVERMERLKERLTRRRAYSTGVLFVSALSGLPPFYALSILAGTLRFPFALFLPAGLLGRLIRFGLFVWAPELMMKLRGHG